MQYRRLDPNQGILEHLRELRAEIRGLDTAPTGDVGLSGQIVATDPETGVETIIGRLPDGSTGIQQWVNDTTPPGEPSAPTAEPTIGGVMITWDGLMIGSMPQPPDYDRTEIEYSSDGAIWLKGGTFTKANTTTVPSLTIGTSYSFRLVSYDHNNNASTPSTLTSATPVAMTDNPDIELALQDLRDKDTEIAGNVTDATTAASEAKDDALEAFNKAKSVPTTFYGPAKPGVDPERAFVIGDTWYDTDDNNKIYVWDGIDFALSIDPRIEQNNASLNDLTEPGGILDSMQNDLDSKITTYYGPAPATKAIGDLWLDATDPDNQILKRWDGSIWAVFDNPRVQDAYIAAGNAQTTADKKVQTFTGTSAPANDEANDLGVGDLWIDTTAGSGKISRWMGTTTGWQEVVDNGAAAANKALADLGLNEQWKQDIESQADRAIATFYGPDSPTGMQIGDIWLSGVAGTPMKRWDGDSWETFEDPNVAAAYARAGEALTAADTKIITYAQPTAPTGLTSPTNDGDLWINTSADENNGKISRFSNNAWTIVTDNGASAASSALKAAESQILAAAGLAASKGKVWFQNDAPISGQIHRWTGTAHSSTSEKITNGSVTRTNRFTNPSFETNTTGVSSASVTTSLTGFASAVAPNAGSSALNISVNSGATQYTYVAQFAEGLTAGNYFSWASHVRWSSGSRWARLRIIFRDAANATIGSTIAGPMFQPASNTVGGTRQSLGAIVPAGATKALCLIYFYDDNGGAVAPTAGSVFSTDAWCGIEASTQSDADTAVLDYFDGDSQDDRANDLWIDTNDGNKPYRWNSPTDTWVLTTDQRILDAIDLANSAAKSIGFSGNPSFDDWTSTVPNGYVTYTTAPTKETTTVRIPKNGARWSITTTAQQAGLQFAGGVVGGHLPNLEYYTIELEFYLVSGTLSGAGVILDWNGTSMTNNRATINLGTELPTVNTGKWYRVTKTVRRPTNMTGTWSSMGGYLMANWSGVGGAIKNIIFDWFNVRPATAEEITAYGVPATVQTLNNSIDAKGKVIIQSAVPSTLDRLPQNLWIDTTLIGNPAAPGNVPKRWNATTSQWEAVTEKAVIDAAAAAAKANEDASTAINDADLAYQAAGERSRIVHLNTTPPTPTDGWKDGDVWYKHTTVDITSPVIDWYIWNNNGWQLQALDETFLPLVNIGAGTYGTMSGTRLDANTVSAREIRIGDFTNLITNGFGDLGVDSLGKPIGWASGLTYETVDKPASVTGVFKSSAGQGTYVPPVEYIDVTPNTEYLTEIWLKADKPNSDIYVELRNQDGALGTSNIKISTGTSEGSYALSSEPVPTTWTLYQIKSTTYSTTTRLRIGSIYFNHSGGAERTATISIAIGLRRRAAGSLLVDGAIDGKTITGALIQSRTEANMGIKLSGTQFVAYNNDGTEALRLDGTNSMMTGAVIRTAVSGARTQIDSTGIHSWDVNNFEHFSVTATGVTMTGVVEAKGITHPLYNNGEPISTFIGNVPIKEIATGVTNYIPGIEWELARVGAMNSNPSITSYAGYDLWITSGVNTANDYAQLHLDSGTGKSTLTGINGIVLDPRKGIVDTPGDIRAHQLKATGGSMTGRAVINLASDTLAGTWFSIDGGVGGDEPAIWADTVRNLNVRAGSTSYINFVSSLAFKGIAMGAPAAAGLTYANGWSNFGSGYAPMKTILIAEGTVALTGMPKPGTRADGVIIGYVDPAVRPSTLQYLECTIRAGTAQYPGMLKLGTNGALELYSGGNHGSISYLAIGSVYSL